MERFFELLQLYLNPKEDVVKKWRELEQLLSLMGSKDLAVKEQNLAVFLVLQAENHMLGSCYYKAYELAGDLRDKIEALCLNVIKHLPKIISDALLIEMKRHRISEDEYLKLVKNASSSISMHRNWNFYVLKHSGVSEFHVFNLVSPSVILIKHLAGYEKSLIDKGEFFPICHDIADRLRIDYWLSARGKLDMTS